MPRQNLRVVLFFTLVLTICAENVFEKNARKIIKGVVDRLCHGVPSMGIPKMEPFEQKQPVELNFNHSLAKISGSISNIHMAGLSSLKLIDLELKASLTFSFTIKIPKITALAQFKLKGFLGGLFPIDGDGIFDISVDGTQLSASAGLGKIDKDLQLVQLKAQPKIDGLRVNIVNLVPNKDVNDFINKALNTLGPQLVEDIWHDLGDSILREVEQLSKSVLKDINIFEITQIVAGMKPAFAPDDPPADCN